MAPIIQLQNLSKRYGAGAVVAVDDVTLAVEDGEFVTLLGPSGCGKSTLLRMIGGFETPSAGVIRLADEDVTWAPPYRRAVNMVFQDYALFPHMTVGQNVAYGLQVMKLSKSEIATRVYDSLALVGLADRRDHRPHQLSGGQRQRVALARAMVRRPKVLLLDEPLSALDAKLREQMQIELKRLHETVGITFIMVTHDQTEALTMSDRVVVMEAGRVAQSGRPHDLYDHPASPYVANFIGATNFLSGEVAGVEGARARIHAAGTCVAADLDAPRRAGEAVTLGFRPEKARLLAEDESEETVLQGRIEDVVYYGLGLRLGVELAGGEKVFVDARLADRLVSTELPARGASVRVGVAARNVFVFDRGAETEATGMRPLMEAGA